MKLILIIISGFISIFSCYSQLDSSKISDILVKSYLIESSSNNQKNCHTLKLDSIDIYVEQYENKIKTINRFSESESVLEIDYYFIDNNLLMISIIEPSPIFQKDSIYTFSSYYFEENVLIGEEYRYTIGGPLNKDKYELFGYNRFFTNEFLKRFSILLYDKINNIK